jgi:uncharacterized protein
LREDVGMVESAVMTGAGPATGEARARAELRVEQPELRLADLRPRLDPERYAVARYPQDWQLAAVPDGWSAVIRDGDEVTLVAAERAFDGGALGAIRPLALERGWRRVTFPGPLPWEQVGFLADVATRLASAYVPFTSMSGFTTDHLLVREAHAELAMSVLAGHPPPPQRPGTNP